MERSAYTSLPTSHLPGSVPAAISEEKVPAIQEVPEANLQIFPPNYNGGGGRGYQTLTSPNEGDGQQSANSWSGAFSVSSYKQFFNVDTDDVVHRLTSSLYPSGDFFRKIDANPDLYGLIWISTTLVFVVAALGNCATYLMGKRSNPSTSWSFDVSYIQVSAMTVYGYVILVPLTFYLLLQYLGSKVGLVHFWCMWGYSLFIFIITSFVLVIPVGFVRWSMTLVSGAASAAFVGFNLMAYVESNDVTMVAIAACVLQFGLAIFIKSWFFH